MDVAITLGVSIRITCIGFRNLIVLIRHRLFADPLGGDVRHPQHDRAAG